MKETITQKKTTINDLSERFDIVFDIVNDMKANQAKAVIIPVKPKSVIMQHVDAFVDNAFKSPHSTLSGLMVGVSFLGSKMFPQYAPFLQETQVFFTGLTGVTAGSALINPKTNVPTKPLPSQMLNDSENEKIYG